MMRSTGSATIYQAQVRRYRVPLQHREGLKSGSPHEISLEWRVTLSEIGRQDCIINFF
uniref:Uncharacterized protein n=1 Tax=Coccidioides posadasii RMSCC 3488 TaxID=454284 RepID=A0A0J6FL84_COCPO|nr:hypothetical protein CPAG_06512 [Coccidioides posadasii RMSCC 3488]